MNLDDWKDRAREVKAPGTGTGGPRPGGRALDGLIRVLKAEDESDRKRLRRTAIFFSILGVAYVLLFALTWILPPDPPPSPGMSRLALTLAFLCFLLIDYVNGKAGMNEDVVAGFGLGSQLETGAPFDPADFNPGHGFLN